MRKFLQETRISFPRKSRTKTFAGAPSLSVFFLRRTEISEENTPFPPLLPILIFACKCRAATFSKNRSICSFVLTGSAKKQPLPPTHSLQMRACPLRPSLQGLQNNLSAPAPPPYRRATPRQTTQPEIRIKKNGLSRPSLWRFFRESVRPAPPHRRPSRRQIAVHRRHGSSCRVSLRYIRARKRASRRRPRDIRRCC